MLGCCRWKREERLISISHRIKVTLGKTGWFDGAFDFDPHCLLIASLFTLHYLARIPLPLYSGAFGKSAYFIYPEQSVIDNCNIGYILLVLTLFPVIDRIPSFEPKTINFYGLIILPLFGLIISSLLVSMLLSFTTHESLIILLSFVIYPFMPTYYRIRTSFFPFMFSGVGSLTFILAPLFPVLGDWCLSSSLIIIPFYVKIPVYPLFYRLPEVHCEANTRIALVNANPVATPNHTLPERYSSLVHNSPRAFPKFMFSCVFIWYLCCKVHSRLNAFNYNSSVI